MSRPNLEDVSVRTSECTSATRSAMSIKDEQFLQVTSAARRGLVPATTVCKENIKSYETRRFNFQSRLIT